MTDITVSRELLRQVLVRLELGGPGWERDNMIKALRAALEQVQQPGEVCARCGGLVYDPVLDVTDGDAEYKHVCNLWMDEKTLNYEIDRCERPSSKLIPAYIKTQLAAPVQEQQPVAYRYKYLNFMGQEVWSFDRPRGQDAKVLETQAVYTAQPRKVVKLSDTQPPCSDHPDAPHGFNRNMSHTLNRYVCDCEGWTP